MTTKYTFSWVLILGLMLSVTAMAKSSNGLDQAVVPVKDRSAKSLQLALTHAYGEVLVKMSGNPTVMTIPKIQNSLDQINHYVASYRYQMQPNPITRAPQLYLQAGFDAKEIDNLLRRSGQTVWSKHRPLTLVVLMVPNKTGWQILSSASDDVILANLSQLAQQRGLQVIYPIMDLEDQDNFSVDSTVVISDMQLQNLAKRYNVHSILLGRVTQNIDASNTINWQLVLNQTSFQWKSISRSLADSLPGDMNQLLDKLANHYATMSSNNLQDEVLLRVSGVNGLTDYVRVVNVVKHLAGVEGVHVKDMSQNNLLLQVNVAGGEESLRSVMDKSQQLAPENNVPDSAVPAVDLYYHWGKVTVDNALDQ